MARKYTGWALVIAVGLAGPALVGAQEPAAPAQDFVADARVADAIRAFIARPGEEDSRQAEAALREIEAAVLVPQLIHYSAHARATHDGMAAGVIIERLRIRPDVVIRALVPYLGAPDEAFDASIRRVLGGYEGRTAERGADFSIYRDLIEPDLRAGRIPPAELVEYLFEADAGAALLLLMRAGGLREPDRIRPILWAEHTIADTLWKQRYGFLAEDETEPAAVDQLAMLARHEAWWARRYAVEIMRSHAEFRSEVLLVRLENDEVSLVRDAARALRPQP